MQEGSFARFGDSRWLTPSSSIDNWRILHRGRRVKFVRVPPVASRSTARATQLTNRHHAGPRQGSGGGRFGFRCHFVMNQKDEAAVCAAVCKNIDWTFNIMQRADLRRLPIGNDARDAHGGGRWGWGQGGRHCDRKTRIMCGDQTIIRLRPGCCRGCGLWFVCGECEPSPVDRCCQTRQFL